MGVLTRMEALRMGALNEIYVHVGALINKNTLEGRHLFESGLLLEGGYPSCSYLRKSTIYCTVYDG